MSHVAAPALPQPRRFSGANATLAITIPALAACLVVVAASPHGHLLDPLTGALALCAVGASLGSMSLEYPLLVDASFIPTVLAAALGGPAEAFLIASISELGAWALHRHRLVVVPANVLSLGGPMLLAGLALRHVAGDGLSFYAALGAVALLAVAMNAVLLTALIGLLDGSPVIGRLRDHLRLMPAIGINVALAVGATAVYRSTGLAAVLLVLLVILTFNHMVNQVLTARRRMQRIETLAETRTRLSLHALAAEDTARRSLASDLHDGPLQDLLVARQELLHPSEDESVSLALQAVEAGISQLRSSVFELHPAVLEHAGLAAALEAYGRRVAASSGLNVAVDVAPFRTALEVERLTFSLCRELMRNSVAHASAAQLSVEVSERNGRVVARVTDDGIGFDTTALAEAVRAGHIGLTSVRERAEGVGGAACLESATGRGTVATFWLPVPAAAPAR